MPVVGFAGRPAQEAPESMCSPGSSVEPCSSLAPDDREVPGMTREECCSHTWSPILCQACSKHGGGSTSSQKEAAGGGKVAGC
jgi:hypothetical protein